MTGTRAAICVFAGSGTGTRPEYRHAAEDLGRALVDRGLDLVYGGAHVGLMGVVADAVLASGGKVTGVIPDVLVAKEVAHRGLSDLRVVRSMHERKALMAELADAFVALPGGWGTLEELFEVLTWGQLGLHQKPCGLINTAGYFDGLLTFLDHAMEQGFVREELRGRLVVEATPHALLNRALIAAPPAVARWITPDSA